MIKLEQALERVLSNSPVMDRERVMLEQLPNRVLAEDVFADRDMPPFHKSAVDGYACQDPAEGDRLEVQETIPAGAMAHYRVDLNTCSKIMTGAAVPEGSNWIVMVENVRPTGNGAIHITRKGKKSNIAVQGEDFRKGDLILPAGIVLQPQHIAILASVGAAKPLVYRKPSVNLIPTGNELVEPDEIPSWGKIRNTNAPQLVAQFRSTGIDPHYQGIINDTETRVLEVLKQSINNFTLTVLTGGISMGDYDFVPEMMEKAGMEILFHNMAVKPGKPTIFGRKGDHLAIGLPGNPVSTFLQFELLIKPMIYKMMGSDYQPRQVRLPLAETIKSKKEERDSWKPVQIHANKVYTLNYHGSGHIHALYKADGFICIPAETILLKKDTLIDVRQI